MRWGRLRTLRIDPPSGIISCVFHGPGSRGGSGCACQARRLQTSVGGSTESGDKLLQGGVLSPLLSNIMLHEFDCWLEAKYLNKKAKKDRLAWNFGIQQGRPITVRENCEVETCRRPLSPCR